MEELQEDSYSAGFLCLLLRGISPGHTLSSSGKGGVAALVAHCTQSSSMLTGKSWVNVGW
jgi:hypothetical protein